MKKYVEYKNGGARGPSLNTILPHDWDYHIQTALQRSKKKPMHVPFPLVFPNQLQ